ncbi:MAG: zinc-ribbon domain-containing protein [Candidatus Gallimonas sp.]
MKYCSHCGTELADDASFCSHCGVCVQNGNGGGVRQRNESDNTLITLINVFLIIACVVNALCSFGIALAWCLPMTIQIRRRLKEGTPVGLALKVCTLIFVNMVSGILLLCYNDGSN